MQYNHGCESFQNKKFEFPHSAVASAALTFHSLNTTLANTIYKQYVD